MGYNRETLFMKKISLTTAAIVGLLLTFGLMSCHKDGVFNAKHKIKRVYTEESNGDKILSEIYFWNGDLLEQVTYHDTYADDPMLKFEYNKNNQVVKANGFRNNEPVNYVTFTYKNGLYDEINYFMSGSTESFITLNFTHSNNKIKTMKFSVSMESIFGDTDAKAYALFNRTMSLFMPIPLPLETIIKHVDSKQDLSSDKVSAIYTFEWKGNNVVKMSSGPIEVLISNYDNKSNPLQGFIVNQSLNLFCFSKNNPAKIEYHVLDEMSTIDYTYTYDGDVPVQIVTAISGDYLPVGYGPFIEGVKYYEYQ